MDNQDDFANNLPEQIFEEARQALGETLSSAAAALVFPEGCENRTPMDVLKVSVVLPWGFFSNMKMIMLKAAHI